MIKEISVLDLLLSEVKKNREHTITKNIKYSEIRKAKLNFEKKNKGMYVDCSYRSIDSIANKYSNVFHLYDTYISVNVEEIFKESLSPNVEL